jgi:hypothetical protein
MLPIFENLILIFSPALIIAVSVPILSIRPLINSCSFVSGKTNGHGTAILRLLQALQQRRACFLYKYDQ